MRQSRCLSIAFLLAVGTLSSGLRANHFEVALTLSDGRTTQTGKTETEPPQAREIVVRPTMQTAFGAKCTATWKVTSKNKETLKDVLVHFYVVRIDKPGQAPPPLEPNEVVIETAQSIDFADRNTTSATLEFTPDRLGIYLIRIETQGVAEAKGHEHYAAIELTVK